MLEHGKWIRSGKPAECPVFSRAFSVDKALRSAKLTITAAGVYEAQLNGQRVGDFFLAPGWTTYEKRLQVQEYDVTTMLRSENRLSVTVGSGWFNGTIARQCKPEGVPVLLLAELKMDYTDGTTSCIYTDRNWQTTESAIRYADIYNGETFDAAFEDENPVPAVEQDFPKTQLIPQEGEIVRLHERLKPVRVIHTPAGETVLDFGQEVTGILQLTVNARRGDHITLRTAEMLDRDGNFYIENYREAKSTMQLFCRDGLQTWQPALTYYGFRYIRVEGWPGEPDPQAFTAIAAYSDMRRTGALNCGVQKVNRLFENIVWGQKGNFLDVPTDCPQRNERLGWLGDAEVFINTACYQFDTKKFYTKWLGDVMVEQKPNGSMQDMVPAVFNTPELTTAPAGAAWGDAATVCPWELYRHYGDRSLLESHYDMMVRWVDYITSVTTTPNLWTGYEQNEPRRHHYGDWLGLDAQEGSYVGATDKELIATAYYALSTRLVCKAGHVLGRDVRAYEELYERIRDAFRRTYTEFPTQTACAVALYFDLAADKAAVADQLVRLIHDNGDRLTTGFVGTPYLLYALSQNGHTDVAYTLLLQEKFPSWLYSVNQGATTIWEHWDGRREDGTFWSANMNSFNHYAYGSVAGWVYEEAAGITPCDEEPGFARVRIAPKPDARMGWLTASVDTAHGTIRSEWAYEDGRVRYQIATPVPAEIVINGESHFVEPGVYLF